MEAGVGVGDTRGVCSVRGGASQGQPRCRAWHLMPEPRSAATPQYQTECVSGCMCPEGLIDDGRGGCVVEEDCPCVHNKGFFSRGDKIKVDCNTW